VNAAGTSLEMGSGVAGALRRTGGEELNDDATANARPHLEAGACGVHQCVRAPSGDVTLHYLEVHDRPYGR
jgi:O-acetyl-ADP-ribose deacetylase (regulator of RNase III)